tara:strand:+ start:71 stop:388 length:318 start_codon:yes stop_codon:yes gene_type:complete
MKIIVIIFSALGFLFSGELTTTYRIDGMMCTKSCVKKVNETLNSVDGVKSYQVDFESGTATVVYDDVIIDSKRIAKSISEKTYYKVEDISGSQKRSFWSWLFGKK